MQFNKKNFKNPSVILFISYVIIGVTLLFSIKGINYINSALAIQDQNIFLQYFNLFIETFMYSSIFPYLFIFAVVFFFCFYVVNTIISVWKSRTTLSKGALIFLFLKKIILSLFKSIFISVAGVILTIIVGYLLAVTDLGINSRVVEGKFISNEDEILKIIDQSTSSLKIYDAANEKGVILALRGLQDKEKLNTYEAVLLPVAAKIFAKPSGSSILYVPTKNSIVYLNFKEDNGGTIISKLAINKIKYSDNENIADSMTKKALPSIQYVSDEEYTKFISEKNKDIRIKDFQEYQLFIKKSEQEAAECDREYQDTVAVVIEQEDEYAKNCIQQINYSDCSDYRKLIDSNIKVREESAKICQEHRVVLKDKYTELDRLKQNTNEESLLEKQKSELTNGMYFFDRKEIIMRNIKTQDSFEYLKTLLHEIFHHYSNTVEMPIFIEEGITDYLTLKLLGMNKYEMIATSGYFKEVQIIFALLEKIPEEELVQSYLDGENNSFESLFKKYFPDVEYSTFIEEGNDIFNGTFEIVKDEVICPDDDAKGNPCDIQNIRERLGLERENQEIYN